MTKMMSVRLGDPRHCLGTVQFAAIVHYLAQMCPRGFRQPSAKAKNWMSTSLVEIASRAAGMMPPPRFERSKRGERRAEMDFQFRRSFALQEVSPRYLRRGGARGG